MVCRVFQKSLAAKKPQQTSSSQPESPCDTTSNMVNDQFGDVHELPNLNTNIASNSSSQSFNVGHDHLTNHVNTNMNLMTMNNWPSASSTHHEIPTFPSLPPPWPSGLLNPNNISMNSLLLKALQLRSYQQQQQQQQKEAVAAAANINHFASYNMPPPQGVLVPPLDPSSNNNLSFSSSSSKVLECMPQHDHHQQEQPFNLDSIW